MGKWRSERELVFDKLSLKEYTDADGNLVLAVTKPGEPSDITPYGFVRADGGDSMSGYGAQCVRGVNEEEITLDTGAAATDSAGNLLPADSFIEAVVVRCTTSIGTAASYSLGDATQAARFLSASTKKTKGDTAVGTLHLNPAVASDNLGPRQTTAAALRVTCNTTPSAGKLRVAVFYRTYSAPTS